MTHPLTEEMMDKIHGDEPGYSNPYDENDMRAAADWQLAQCLQFVLLNYGQEAMVPFMEAMRPTQENNK